MGIADSMMKYVGGGGAVTPSVQNPPGSPGFPSPPPYTNPMLMQLASFRQYLESIGYDPETIRQLMANPQQLQSLMAAWRAMGGGARNQNAAPQMPGGGFDGGGGGDFSNRPPGVGTFAGTVGPGGGPTGR